MQRMPGRTSAYSNLPARRAAAFAPRFRQRFEKPEPLPRKIERVLKRNSQRLLAGVALLLLIGQAPAFASTINVNSRCTLGRAIAAANTDTTAVGFCAQGRGPDTIVMPPNSLEVLTSVNNITYGATGLPVIRTPISIIGNDGVIIRAPQAPRFRIFAVGSTGRLTLSRLTIRGGFAPSLGGGGIRSLGSIALIDAVLDGNGSVGSGGGLWAQNIVTIIRSKFSRNQSQCPPPPAPPVCNGGASFYTTGQSIPGQAVPSTLRVESSKFEGNIAGKSGGGLQVNGIATINNSALADNSAQQGGAIAVGTALASFGAGNVTQQSLRLDLAAQPASVLVTNTTLTDNRAAVSGGGIAISDGSALTLNNAVVSGNSAPQAPEAVAQPGSMVNADNFNTIGFGGNEGVVGFPPLGATDEVAPQAPPDPIPDLPPLPLEPPPDTGTTPPDTGTTPPDTGTTPPDTGTTPPDTGTTPPDTGTTPPDTGTTPPDTGTTPPDTGTTPPDTGTTPPDTGTTPPEPGQPENPQ